MAKMMNLGVASRFALLKIEDDDEEEQPGAVSGKSKGGGQKKTTRTKFVPLSAAGGSTSQKNKKKKHGKSDNKTSHLDSEKFDDDENGETKQLEEALRLSQLTYDNEEEQRRQLCEQENEDIKRVTDDQETDCRAEGYGNIVETQAPNEEFTDSDEEEIDTTNQISKFAKETVAEVKKVLETMKQRQPDADRPVSIEKTLCKLYKSKFDDLVKLAKEKEKQAGELKSELTKVKTRNKKLCEVLADAETREKAELVAERQKVTKLNEELMQQISEVHAELEQARSRIHELENEQKKHSKSNK